MGIRTRRYVLVVDDGEVILKHVERGLGYEETTPEKTYVELSVRRVMCG